MHKTKSQKLSIRFLKFLFFIICFAIAFNMMQPDTDEEKQKIHERSVRIACIVGIKKMLNHPGSMEIKNRTVFTNGENKWIAEIGIQARNNFNVMVPSKFICNVCLENDGYQLKTIRGD